MLGTNVDWPPVRRVRLQRFEGFYYSTDYLFVSQHNSKWCTRGHVSVCHGSGCPGQVTSHGATHQSREVGS